MQDSLDIVNERGEYAQFVLNEESTISRDMYGSRTRNENELRFNVNCFPVDPNEQNRLYSQSGLREEVDVIIVTAKQFWINESIEDRRIIPEKTIVKYRGETYEIRYKKNVSHFADDYLYIEFGLFKK
jgi:hypothetical protein